MNVKIEMHQYVIFMKPRNLDTQDFKSFTVMLRLLYLLQFSVHRSPLQCVKNLFL